MQRDKVNLDIFWLKDENLEDSENLPDPDVLAQEIMEKSWRYTGAVQRNL